jgi:hypothetical protein
MHDLHVVWQIRYTTISYFFFIIFPHIFWPVFFPCVEMDRIVNRNYRLYGPGPLARRPTGLGAKPPLQGLVICAGQALAFAMLGGLAYRFAYGNPRIHKIEQYYQEHPPR